MSFFELPPRPTEEDRDDEPAPYWAEPGPSELGIELPLHLTLGESDAALVVLQSATWYEHGLTLHVAARTKAQPPFPKPFDEDDDEDPFSQFHERWDMYSSEFLRFGLQFADGRKVTNLMQFPDRYETRSEPTTPILTGWPESAGLYGRGGVDVEFWL